MTNENATNFHLFTHDLIWKKFYLQYLVRRQKFRNRILRRMDVNEREQILSTTS